MKNKINYTFEQFKKDFCKKIKENKISLEFNSLKELSNLLWLNYYDITFAMYCKDNPNQSFQDAVAQFALLQIDNECSEEDVDAFLDIYNEIKNKKYSNIM